MKKRDKEIIDNIIYHRLDGDSCVESAENYVDDVKDVDTQLYSSMRRLNEAASDMINRLRELNDELNLEHKTSWI